MIGRQEQRENLKQSSIINRRTCGSVGGRDKKGMAEYIREEIGGNDMTLERENKELAEGRSMFWKAQCGQWQVGD
jgi:hypothetical protein